MAGRISRGKLLTSAALGALAGFAVYSLWWEPAMRLRTVRWQLYRPEWLGRKPIRIVALSDLHAGAPFVSLDRISRIIARANALDPDVAVILGDLVGGHPFIWGDTDIDEIAARLAGFQGREGCFAIIGDEDVQGAERPGMPNSAEALLAAGIVVLDNKAVRIGSAEDGFWLAGLGEQTRRVSENARIMKRTLSYVTDDAPVVLLAHIPDIFRDLDIIDGRVGVQISGHTHGGQVRILGSGPLLLASDNDTYSWGRYDENGRTLIVSGGIGCSVLPMRVGCIPELTVVEIAGGDHF